MGVGVHEQINWLGAKRPGALRAPSAIVALLDDVFVQGLVAAVGAGVKLEPLASNERWGS